MIATYTFKVLLKIIYKCSHSCERNQQDRYNWLTATFKVLLEITIYNWYTLLSSIWMNQDNSQ